MKRIKGNDRALMMLCRDARRRWLQYNPEYKEIKKKSFCEICKKIVQDIEVDHVERIGKRPRTFEEFSTWLIRLFTLPLQGLCHKHHLRKTNNEKRMD